MRGLPPHTPEWIRRFHEAGEAGLLSHSRRPVRSPNRRVFEKERRLILSLRVERKREHGEFRANCGAIMISSSR